MAATTTATWNENLQRRPICRSPAEYVKLRKGGDAGVMADYGGVSGGGGGIWLGVFNLVVLAGAAANLFS